MKITILQFGKNKNSYIEEGIAEYVKRLGAFCNLGIITLKEATGRKTAKEQIEEESKELRKKLENYKEYFKIVLDIDGKQLSSKEFATSIKQVRDFGSGKLLIVIGGPFGLTHEVKSAFDLALSFGRMTYTHQMVRLLLFEQIYRAFTIIEGKTYHY